MSDQRNITLNNADHGEEKEPVLDPDNGDYRCMQNQKSGMQAVILWLSCLSIDGESKSVLADGLVCFVSWHNEQAV